MSDKPQATPRARMSAEDRKLMREWVRLAPLGAYGPPLVHLDNKKGLPLAMANPFSIVKEGPLSPFRHSPGGSTRIRTDQVYPGRRTCRPSHHL